MDCVEPFYKVLCPLCVVAVVIIGILVGVIEVFGGGFDGDDEVKGIYRFVIEGCDCKDGDGYFANDWL